MTLRINPPIGGKNAPRPELAIALRFLLERTRAVARKR
jgi:hypothetical protein